MKTKKKVSIIIAVLSLIAGLIISFCALIAINFDFSELNTLNYVTNTHMIEETFENIRIDGAECDIRFVLTTDGSKVVCTEGDKIYHTVEVANDTLTIQRIDSRKWYEHIGIYWGKMEIVVYLPKNEYETLFAKSLSGNIEISDEFSFNDVQISNTSGNVRCLASAKDELTIKTVSGDLYVGDTISKSIDLQSTSGNVIVLSAKTEADFKVNTVSGDIELTDVECENSTADTTSGSVNFSNVISSDTMNIKSVSGNINLVDSDADSLSIKTTSGDVSGSLLTEKIFITDTESGVVDVPISTNGGKCEIKTTSGNIEFSIS